MKVIGLTGNIGCGKSTVAGWLREMGVAVIDLDSVARQIRNNDAEARRRIEAGTFDPWRRQFVAEYRAHNAAEQGAA